ncbi:uncharacterized protein LOC144875332 [Branchiostoma floridae x Branchiostoma japonicum]
MVLSSAPLPPQHRMTTESKIAMADPQPQPPAEKAGPPQMLFGQNQQETGMRGVQGDMQFTPQYIRRAQPGMQFRLPQAGGMQGSVQCRPQLQYQDHFSCQQSARNAMMASSPRVPLMRIPGDPSMQQNSHGDISQCGQQVWSNPLQSRVPQIRKSGWSQECRRLPHTAVFGAAAAKNGPCTGTFGTFPAHHHKQYKCAAAESRGASVRSGMSSQHRRRKRPSSEDEGPSSKLFLSEEKMAAHLKKLSISNDHTYVGMATPPGSSSLSPTQDKNRVVIEDLSDDSSDEWASSSDSDVDLTIQISPELQKGLQQVAGERLLPEGLFERLNRPCMDVVLWKPPEDFVQSVLNSSSSPNQRVISTAVHSESLQLPQDNPSPSPVSSSRGEGEGIDTDVVNHGTQRDVTMFDCVDDDMEL